MKQSKWSGISHLVLLLSILISSHFTDACLVEVCWREQERQGQPNYRLVLKKRLVSEPKWLYYAHILRNTAHRRAFVMWLCYRLLQELYWLLQQLLVHLPSPPPTGLYGESWRTELNWSDQVCQVELTVLLSISPVPCSLREIEVVKVLPSSEQVKVIEATCSTSQRVSSSQVAEKAFSVTTIEPTIIEPRQRNCSFEQTHTVSSRGRHQVRLPVDQEVYSIVVSDATTFRQWLDEKITQFPELFPTTINEGYILDGFLPASKKMPDVRLRRIKLKVNDERGCGVYTIVPSYILSYMRGHTDEVEIPLFLRRFGVPYWALTKLFGRDDMYWYRLECSFGNYSIVGTTVKQADKLPQDVLADEKHTHFNGHKAYIAMTGANDCIFSTGATLSANTEALTQAYQTFKTEAQLIHPTYSPQTVNFDGWAATQNAWSSIFPDTVPINCFLHAFIKIRSRCKSQPYFQHLSSMVWNAYHAPDKETFSQHIDQLQDWASLNIPQQHAQETVQKLCHRKKEFLKSYDYPNAFRTSTWLDQQMKSLDRYLFTTNYFHGHLASMDKRVRAWAILHNFRPYCPKANSLAKLNFISPAHKINQKLYHHNWLQNLLVSASLNGFRHNQRKN
jgi:hypothetical protein